ncbi:unnamed protein product [Mucor hiemalis]
MVELTEQEKLERRRQKRQQRILQAGESRLGKITGTAFPNRATPSPTPSPSTSSVRTPTEPTPTSSMRTTSTVEPTPPSFRTQRRDSDDPSEELGAPQPTNQQQEMNNMMNQTFASMFGGVAGIPGSEGMGFNPAALLGAMNGGGGDNEALQKLLAGQANPNDPNAAPFDPSSLFGGGQQKVESFNKVLEWITFNFDEWTRGGSERFASLLYSNVGVSNYPSIHVPLFWYFVTLELGLQSARLFYQQGTMPPTSTIATLATQLPSPFGNIVLLK